MRTAIITGASGAIGGAIAKRIAAEGIAVVLCSNLHPEHVEQLKDGIVTDGGEAVCFSADLGDFENAEKIASETERMYGRIDYLVAAAGISHRGLFTETDENVWDGVMDANLKSFAAAAKAVIPRMLKLGEGSILAVSSVWGKTGASMETVYSASKAGMAGLARALAKEYGFSGIRVNCISPGAIETPMNGFLSEQEKEQLTAEIPAGRFGTPEEVAEIACSVLMNRYITGTDLTVDGGFTL